VFFSSLGEKLNQVKQSVKSPNWDLAELLPSCVLSNFVTKYSSFLQNIQFFFKGSRLIHVTPAPPPGGGGKASHASLFPVFKEKNKRHIEYFQEKLNIFRKN